MTAARDLFDRLIESGHTEGEFTSFDHLNRVEVRALRSGQWGVYGGPELTSRAYGRHPTQAAATEAAAAEVERRRADVQRHFPAGPPVEWPAITVGVQVDPWLHLDSVAADACRMVQDQAGRAAVAAQDSRVAAGYLRDRARLAVRRGAPKVDVAAAAGVSRPTLDAWLSPE